MKLYEYIKSKNSRTLKVLGFTIMRKSFSSGRSMQKFLGGLVTTSKVYFTYLYEKEIKILGCSFSICYDENNSLTYSIFGKTICKISLFNIRAKRFKKRYFTYFDRQYDDIYLFDTNSGEAYMTLAYFIDILIKRNKSKNPLLVATKKYHLDMMKTLCPDIPHTYIENLDRIGIVGKEFKIETFRFFVLYDGSLFKQEDYLNDRYKSFLKYLELTDNDLSYRKVIISPKDERSMLDKATKIGLNLDRFVFLAPEANSVKLYDEEFWVMLINVLQDRGYDVFVNLTSDQIKLEGARDFKACNLSFVEVFALAKYSKRIITLRSGFTEFLLQTNVPMDILYTIKNFGDKMIESILLYTIRDFLFIDQSKIREFNTSKITPEGLLKTILKEL